MKGLFISEKLELECLEINKKLKLTEFFNRKIFRVSDSSLTYRQLNNLEKSGLFESTRKENSDWRKMSFREIVYMLLVAELRKYGLKNNQLFGLKDIFLERHDVANLVLGVTCVQVQMILAIDYTGECGIFDPHFFLLMQTGQRSQIVLTVNDFVNQVLKKMERKTFPIKWGLKDALLVKTMLEEEKTLANIEENNFKDIRTIKRNGKIINTQKEPVFKLTPLKVRKI